jgi:hypothetical protein
MQRYGCEGTERCDLKSALVSKSMRKLLPSLGLKQLETLGQSAAVMLNLVNAEIRQRQAKNKVFAGITNFDGTETLKEPLKNSPSED